MAEQIPYWTAEPNRTKERIARVLGAVPAGVEKTALTPGQADSVADLYDKLAGAVTVAIEDLSVGGPSAGLPKVSTFSALSAFDPSGGQTVWVESGVTQGDGRGGLFHFLPGSTLATNVGTTFTAIGGRWLRDNPSPMNPRWFGAQGDFVTDDTAAFQAALDSVVPTLGNANQFTCVIKVPEGWYKVSTLTASQKGTEIFSAVKTKGAGFATTTPCLFQSQGAAGPMLKVTGGRVSIHDLQLFGQASANLQNVNTIATVTDRLHFPLLTARMFRPQPCPTSLTAGCAFSTPPTILWLEVPSWSRFPAE